MLSSISIQDFAIIKNLNLDLQKGLNIITGETGAGKSIVIEAISMALGSRADTSYIRNGADKAVITLVVDTDDCKVNDILDEIGAPNDNPLILRREISQNKGVCRVNGTIVPLSSLNLLCKRIADIHGQYDQQILLDPDNHINILDSFAGDNILEPKNKVASLYNEYADYSTQLYKLKKDIAEGQRQRDYLAFEVSEIEDAKLGIGEDEELEEEINIMENSEKLFEALSSSYEEIYAKDKSSIEGLSTSLNALESIEGYSKDIDSFIERYKNIYYELEDMDHDLRSLKDSISYSQSELDEKIERLELIKKLKKKYGGSIEAVIEYGQKSKASLSSIDNADTLLQELEHKLLYAKSEYDKAAEELSNIRKEAAKELEKKITSELLDLNFNDARFSVSFNISKSTDNGVDVVEFLIATNLGSELLSLAKIVSGGELSRIMLALKRIIGDIDGVPSMIFDEIDTGISGATAAVVGEKLEAISKNHQVICITHLPQIASKGESHYRIEKVTDEISTSTTVVPLSKDERIEEIARLISGSTITENARNTAKELLG